MQALSVFLVVKKQIFGLYSLLSVRLRQLCVWLAVFGVGDRDNEQLARCSDTEADTVLGRLIPELDNKRLLRLLFQIKLYPWLAIIGGMIFPAAADSGNPISLPLYNQTAPKFFGLLGGEREAHSVYAALVGGCCGNGQGMGGGTGTAEECLSPL